MTHEPPMIRFSLAMLLYVVAVIAVSLTIVQWLVDTMDIGAGWATLAVLPSAVGVLALIYLAGNRHVSLWIAGSISGGLIAVVWPGTLVLLSSAPEAYELYSFLLIAATGACFGAVIGSITSLARRR